MRSLLAAVAVMMLFEGSAQAAIRIIESRLENGILIVTGQTRPDQPVKLDRKYDTKADAAGRFEFRETYKPPYCMANVTTGDDAYSAVVTNCLLNDAAAASARK